MQQASDPIGVFDSSVGGLSVLGALHAELPHEHFVYVGDSGHAPYGERDDTHVLQRSHAITDYLVARHRIKALVVACNTATASAIRQLRAAYPQLPIVGVEPALKPAALYSKTRVIGVMATRGTLRSEKFSSLLHDLNGDCRFVLQACDGLADAIEHADTEKIDTLCLQYTSALGTFGTAPGHIDTLVLGCTHYPFIVDTLKNLPHIAGRGVAMLDAGKPVALQTRRMLAHVNLLAADSTGSNLTIRSTVYVTTGQPELLKLALRHWLSTDADVLHIANTEGLPH